MSLWAASAPTNVCLTLQCLGCTKTFVARRDLTSGTIISSGLINHIKQSQSKKIRRTGINRRCLDIYQAQDLVDWPDIDISTSLGTVLDSQPGDHDHFPEGREEEVLSDVSMEDDNNMSLELDYSPIISDMTLKPSNSLPKNTYFSHYPVEANFSKESPLSNAEFNQQTSPSTKLLPPISQSENGTAL
ncbi:unnamed protein product [Cylindrotheca closterium]|uniref:Uncharacterized protein n=1 Tax=Cylindrotheca closterium TaxID=2856 RepID=A0AAD2FM09_9STRA|nr:unnamed protein product [Cylindrotheca closterium]